jgi:hypothetical protein
MWDHDAIKLKDKIKRCGLTTWGVAVSKSKKYNWAKLDEGKVTNQESGRCQIQVMRAREIPS